MAARQNNPLWGELPDYFGIDMVWENLAIDPEFPNASTDKLRILCAKIEDENFLPVRVLETGHGFKSSKTE